MRLSPHTALCLLFVPWALWGQSAAPGWQSSIAKVSVDAKLGRTPGTAFVVAVSGQTAYLVTCAHVVVEESSPRVEFRAAPLREFRATVRAREPGDNPRGLALLVVENIPPDVQALSLAATANPVEGERVIVAGFPRPGLRFLAPETTIAGFEGQDLTLSRETVEGFSGGPVLRGDSAIGIVYGHEAGGYGTALVSDTVRTYLRGLKVPFDGGTPTTAAAVQSPSGRMAGDTRENPKSGLKDVWIPPGTFEMGCSAGDTECEEDERPTHPVTITKGFWMGQTEVTVGAYKEYCRLTGNSMPPNPDVSGGAVNSSWSNDALPIALVTWQEATNYCAWVGMRLPTEAEWEYAARAGSREARYGWLNDMAWYGDNSHSERKAVRQKVPNKWKLHDMLGSVWEWTADWYDDRHYHKWDGQDPKGPPSGVYRVLRGGSSRSNQRQVRASERDRDQPGRSIFAPGFRCVGE